MRRQKLCAPVWNCKMFAFVVEGCSGDARAAAKPAGCVGACSGYCGDGAAGGCRLLDSKRAAELTHLYPGTTRGWLRNENRPPVVGKRYFEVRTLVAWIGRRRARNGHMPLLHLPGLHIRPPVPKPLSLRQLLEAMSGCAVRVGAQLPRAERYGRGDGFR